MSSPLTQTLIVVVNQNAFLVLDDPRGRRSVIGISLAYALILNRRFGIPIRRVSLPSTSVDSPAADIELIGLDEQAVPEALERGLGAVLDF
ncbi:hypothetical protein [Mechercharimyces sp. CAU 1602]|uniref:hypothetical protein n=1 Tax=Mechercharimyces sp. CAU 1602 TaxID=2973933 RepID=UPI0021623DA2|nr:hypothetical protein [Mechercharimyces sp. CAU 1602]MCS1351293.1 hypothetical protein [Mechercharimyces sp. CAU 1602]